MGRIHGPITQGAALIILVMNSVTTIIRLLSCIKFGHKVISRGRIGPTVSLDGSHHWALSLFSEVLPSGMMRPMGGTILSLFLNTFWLGGYMKTWPSGLTVGVQPATTIVKT